MMTVKLDFEVRCDKCNNKLHAEFIEEYRRGVTVLVIAVEPCPVCVEELAEARVQEREEKES